MSKTHKTKTIWLIWFCDGKHFMDKVFETKSAACKRAAAEYGFDFYADAKRKGWVEVVKSIAIVPNDE